MGMKARGADSVIIYHNPNCSTSKHAVAAAQAKGISYQEIRYLKQAPDRATLEHLVGMLEDPVEDLVRKDARFKSLGLSADDYAGNPNAVVDLLVQHIELMQRPVLVRGNRAIIGRPKDRVAPFLS